MKLKISKELEKEKKSKKETKKKRKVGENSYEWYLINLYPWISWQVSFVAWTARSNKFLGLTTQENLINNNEYIERALNIYI